MSFCIANFSPGLTTNLAVISDRKAGVGSGGASIITAEVYLKTKDESLLESEKERLTRHCRTASTRSNVSNKGRSPQSSHTAYESKHSVVFL